MVLGLARFLATGEEPVAGETLLTGSFPFYSLYETKDGRWLSVATVEPKFWSRMCERIGDAALASKQFMDGAERFVVAQALAERFRGRTLAEWEALLANENLPIAGVKRVSEVVRDPQVKARGLLPVVDVSGLWKLQVIAHPAKHATLETRNPSRVPAKGQDTEEILRSLGYTARQIQTLAKKASSRCNGRLSPTGRADSRTLELRWALLHEGLDSFVNVVRRGDEAEGHRLQLEGRIDGRVATAIQEHLRQAARDGRLSSESADELADLGRERFVLHGLRHEADRGCLVGCEPKPEKHEFLRLRLTEHSDEPLGPARPGDEAQIHLGLSQLGPLRRDAAVAGQGQFEPASEAMTVDRRERRLGEIGKSVHDLLATPGELPHLERLGNVAEGRQVRSGTERTVPGAGHHDTPDGLVFLQLRKGPLELIEDLRADRVQSIGSIDRDRLDMGLRIPRDQERLEIHPTTSLLVLIKSLPSLCAAITKRQTINV